GVATAELDLALGGALAARIDDEDPVAARVVEEGAVRDQQRLRGIAKGQLGGDGLTALDRGRRRPVEHQIDLELAVANLRVNLGDLEPVSLSVDIGGRALPDAHAAKIIFVDVGL